MKRSKVFELINNERDYQDGMYDGVVTPETPTFDSLNTIGHWIIYMEAYLNRAKSKFFRKGLPEGTISSGDYFNNPQKCHNAHEREVLNDMLKVIALGVAAWEYLGDKK